MTLAKGTDHKSKTQDVDRQTIADFGAQWTHYRENPGYYGSVEMLKDILEPQLPLSEIAGCRVAEIGSGTGRIVNMLLAAGAEHVVALEPSEAMTVLRENTVANADRITYVAATGEHLPLTSPYDIVVSIGVLHHVVDPRPIVARAREALKPGGWIVVWLYGLEGNEAYLRLVLPLRRVTCVMPDVLLRAFTHLLTVFLMGYIALCRVVPLPMRKYMTNVLGKYTYPPLWLTVFDQLNPAYAKYYRKDEALALLKDAGFTNVECSHRHGYSWTVVGRKEA
jgi:SAM-dependent methyltransferase